MVEEYIRNAFKSLEDLNVIIEPKQGKLKEDVEVEEVPVDIESLTIRELFEQESAYIITHEFEYAGHTYSLFLEALNDGESCDITFEEFAIENINEVLAEVLDSEHEFLGSLTGEDITLDTTVGEAISKAHKLIDGGDEIASEETEKEANERVFINGEPEGELEQEVAVEVEPEETEVKEEILNESEALNLNDKEDVEKAKEILDKEDGETVEQIVDASAESKEDLKKTYVGSIILQCPTCKAMMYKDPDQLVKVEGEEELYNIDEECPHCGAKDGFEIVGQVASLDVDPEAEPVPPMVEEPVEIEAEETEVSGIEEEPLDIPMDEVKPAEETNEELESEEEKEESEEGKPSEKEEEKEDSEVEDKEEKEETLNEEVPAQVYTEDEIFEAVESSLKHSGDSTAINVDGKVFVCDLEDVPEHGVPADGNFEFTGCEVTSEDIGKLDSGELFMDGCQAKKHYVVKEGKIESEELTEKCEGEECKEECEHCKEECEHCEEEKECEESCKEESKKEKEIKLESLDETKFDRLVTRYLKETYSNVKSYNTTHTHLNNDENKVLVEGTITFKSEKTKPTKFIFEAKELNAKGQLKLVGINEMFSTSKAFTLLGDINENKLLSESLAYKYEVGGKKVRGRAESFKKR